MLKPSILLAEDNDDMRQLYSLVLAQAGFDVREAMNGKEALAAVKRSRPDVLITDIMMPVMDGLELIARIKNEPALSDLPIIAISAYGGDYLSRAYTVGATGVIGKPIDPDSLIDAVIHALPSQTSH
jgi:two-component system, sensor histidine kinase